MLSATEIQKKILAVNKKYEEVQSAKKADNSVEYTELLNILRDNKVEILSKCKTEAQLKTYAKLLSAELFGTKDAVLRNTKVKVPLIRTKVADLKLIFSDRISFKN